MINTISFDWEVRYKENYKHKTEIKTVVIDLLAGFIHIHSQLSPLILYTTRSFAVLGMSWEFLMEPGRPMHLE